MDDAFKKAEKRGYSKGYMAGRRRGRLDREERIQMDRRAEFRRQAFLAALPTAMTVEDWRMNGEDVKNLDQRTKLAWLFADEAMKRCGL